MINNKEAIQTIGVSFTRVWFRKCDKTEANNGSKNIK